MYNAAVPLTARLAIDWKANDRAEWLDKLTVTFVEDFGEEQRLGSFPGLKGADLELVADAFKRHVLRLKLTYHSYVDENVALKRKKHRQTDRRCARKAKVNIVLYLISIADRFQVVEEKDSCFGTLFFQRRCYSYHESPGCGWDVQR
jgi:hypothetical protein